MKRNRKLWIGMGTAVLSAAFLFLCWWKGLLLPEWIEWKEKDFVYYDSRITVSDHCLKVLTEDQEGKQTEVFPFAWDWNVQDVLPFDINHDGVEELILLVWKHGSYGEHLPIWVKHNDIRLEQHIFIYQWDPARDSKLRPLWMSSALGYEVEAIARGEHDGLIVTNKDAVSRLWRWEDFGLTLAGEAEEKKVTFLGAGDNLIHLPLLKDGAENYDYLYDHVRKEVKQADLASVNQETVFVLERGLISDYPRFGTPAEVGDALLNAGFDIITLSNNHILDKGLYGIRATTSFYDKQEGVTYVGVNPPDEQDQSGREVPPEEAVKIIEKNGIYIALLNYTYGTNGIPSPAEYPYIVERFRDEERMEKQIDYANARADVVIVFAHWGTEYQNSPDEEQQRITKLLLTHNVDVIIGTHPHVLQPYEILTGSDGHQMLVYYSLGNLISEQESPECRIGGLAKFNIVKAGDGTISIQNEQLEKITACLSEGGADGQ